MKHQKVYNIFASMISFSAKIFYAHINTIFKVLFKDVLKIVIAWNKYKLKIVKSCKNHIHMYIVHMLKKGPSSAVYKIPAKKTTSKNTNIF